MEWACHEKLISGTFLTVRFKGQHRRKPQKERCPLTYGNCMMKTSPTVFTILYTYIFGSISTRPRSSPFQYDFPQYVRFFNVRRHACDRWVYVAPGNMHSFDSHYAYIYWEDATFLCLESCRNWYRGLLPDTGEAREALSDKSGPGRGRGRSLDRTNTCGLLLLD
jgi:hypothetical protein